MQLSSGEPGIEPSTFRSLDLSPPFERLIKCLNRRDLDPADHLSSTWFYTFTQISPQNHFNSFSHIFFQFAPINTLNVFKNEKKQQQKKHNKTISSSNRRKNVLTCPLYVSFNLLHLLTLISLFHFFHLKKCNEYSVYSICLVAIATSPSCCS